MNILSSVAGGVKMVPVTKIREAKNNPRRNNKTVAALVKSISEFGFLVPLVLDNNNVILAGHARYKAAREMGMDSVPAIYARDLTPEQAAAFRLADNKIPELTDWIGADLQAEMTSLEAVGMDLSEFGFPSAAELKIRNAWAVNDKRSDLKKNIALHPRAGFWFISLFKSTKEGETFIDIKENRENVETFSICLTDFIKEYFGALNPAEWCITTTPRRRHADFHFATEIIIQAADALGIQAETDVIGSDNTDRMRPDFKLLKWPSAPNVILFDDIISTGHTIAAARELLTEAEKKVFVIAGINNK